MSRIIAELTHDQVEDFFSLKTPNVKTVARSKSGGRSLDPVTGKPTVYTPKTFIPPYKRHAWGNNPQQTAYAAHYREEEEEQLVESMSNMHVGSSRSSTVSGMMEKLESDSTITGISTVMLPEGKTEEQANQVYKNYNFRHEYDPNLSITKHKQEIIDNIESNQVVVVQGPTGSGKTTQVPQYIIDHYASMGKYCNIIVTQPRRIAAMSIATRVCTERQWQQGGLCGYQIGLSRAASEDTRLLFVTTGVLLEKLIAMGHMQQYTHIILDEVHERDKDSDFCLLIVKKYLYTNSRDVKVILMSATAEAEKFASYFSLNVRGYLDYAPIIPIEGRTYKIHEFYLEQLRELGELPVLDPESPSISFEAMELTVKLVLRFDVIENTKGGFQKKSTTRGAVLIFLPGLAEITDLEEKLKVHQESSKWWIIPLHSSITGEEQAAVFRKPEQGIRKIILSTNIAESSITVPDIKFVIDFCLTKNLMCDPETSYSSLQIQWAAKSNCIQRMGRAGRVSEGRVYKMVTRRFYKEFLPQHAVPEMERSPLDVLVLKSKRWNMGEPKQILATALSPPLLDNIEITVLKLKEIGALVPSKKSQRGDYNPYDGDLTFMGRVLSELPVDVHLGKLMMLGHVFGVLEECIIIAACLSLKSFFARPYKSYVESYKKKLEFAHHSFSDCIAYLQAYQIWEHLKETRGFGNRHLEFRWGKEHYIQIKRIEEVSELVDDLRQRLKRNHIVKPRVPPRRQATLTEEEKQLLLKLVLCGAFYPNYFVQGHMSEEDVNKAMSGRNPCTTVMVKGLPQNQGALYRKQLEALFSHCDTANRTLPKISFEETKAFIEFHRDPLDKSNSVLPAVYVALKMRQLRIPLTITLLDTEAANRRMRELSVIQDEKAKATARLRTNRIKAITDAGVVKSEESKLKQVELPSPIQTIVPIYATEIVHCGHFWGHYSDPDTWNNLCSLQKQINEFNGRNLIPLPEDKVKPGTLCLALYEDITVDYYRARIEEIFKTPNGEKQVKVFFLDYGNIDECWSKKLCILEQQYAALPFQAIEVELMGIKPSPLKCPNGRWTEEAKNTFVRLISRKASLFAKVYSILHGVMRVELIEKLPNGKHDNINTRLINLNFADKCEESFLSKHSHEEREMTALMTPALSTDEKTGFDQHEVSDTTSESSGWVKPASNKPLASTVDHWMELPNQDDFVKNHMSGHGRTVKLSGPDSMYEMKFYSMTAIGSLREARIDRDSVNCIAINDTIHEQHARLMVAAHVGLNTTGTTILARDTTIMPMIPGLPALVALLFCPYAEMRCDREKTRYTGALVGLGHCDVTGGPAMPDHDMEITFDTSFDEEDLKYINGVRMGIFISIGSDDTAVEWGHDAIIKIQSSTREKLFSLVQRRRETVEPYFYPRPHQWNCVDEEDMLVPQLEDMMKSESAHLSLHCGIALNVEDSDDDDETDTVKMKEYLELWQGRYRHIEILHSRANTSTIRADIYCELCNITLITPRELLRHLALPSHIQKENIVKEHLY